MPDPSPTAERLDLESQRAANRDALADLGLDPYGRPVSGPEWLDRLEPLASAHAKYDQAADTAHQESAEARKAAKKANPDATDADLPALVDDRPRVTVAGRVVLRRPTGGLVWMNLRDPSRESFQVAVSKRDCDTEGFGAAKLGDLGDLVVVTGPLMKTRTGEVTCWAETLRPASKCLVPPPEKHKGLTDPEARFRRRAMDLWATPHAARTLVLRSHLLRELRRYLDNQGFLEVETPVLQTLAGGAAARPFVTHMNALSIDLFLRIAPELYLKRLMVGGMDAVYEVSRNFRNEGVDRSHNPEFTSLEVYRAYGDYETMARLTEGLVRHLATVAVQERASHPADDDAPAIDASTLTIPFGDLRINYQQPFDRVTYAELFERALGFPMSDTDRVHEAAREHKLKTTGENGKPLDDLLIVNELFEEVAEASIDPARPTFVFDYPASLSPLTRPKAGTEQDPIPLAERWDLFIGGMEIGPAYTELNDPDIQEAKFREQLAGLDDEESTFRTFDQEFIDALKTGMPPAGGLGLGIDRIVMLLSGHDTIREVIAFPLMRPRDARSVVLEILGAQQERTPPGSTLDELIHTIRGKGLLSDVPDATLRTQIDALADRGHLERSGDRFVVPAS